MRKKELGQCTVILTQQAWSMKDLLYGQKQIFCSGTNAGNPKRVHVTRPGSQSGRIGFASSCSLTVSATEKLLTYPSLNPTVFPK